MTVSIRSGSRAIEPSSFIISTSTPPGTQSRKACQVNGCLGVAWPCAEHPLSVP
ncbi:MAG: hypothetical protein MZV63_36065 [Marinilabiliales bacterium]|nr:hypothetical protein [Marinilabiliales bacterium]